jgi:hypothetical protein
MAWIRYGWLAFFVGETIEDAVVADAAAVLLARPGPRRKDYAQAGR